MLPDGVIPIPVIQYEQNIGNKIYNLVVLLEYLLEFIDPYTDSSVGEMVDRNKHLFSNHTDVFFAIGVRNSLTHPAKHNKIYSESEKVRAVNHLFNAISEIYRDTKIPRDIVSEISFDPNIGQNEGGTYQVPIYTKEH